MKRIGWGEKFDLHSVGTAGFTTGDDVDRTLANDYEVVKCNSSDKSAFILDVGGF